MTVPATSARLAERARSGDRAAFDALVARVADRAALFVRLRLGRRLGESVEPDDVLQETWLEAFESFAGFEWRGDDAFAHWICRIAENRLRGLADHHGARKRRPPRPFVRASAVADALSAAETGPATAAQRHERRERLAAAMAGLADDEREALLHRHFEDRTVGEIAALMGRSPSATTRLLGRATARLGALMAERP